MYSMLPSYLRSTLPLLLAATVLFSVTLVSAQEADEPLQVEVVKPECSGIHEFFCGNETHFPTRIHASDKDIVSDDGIRLLTFARERKWHAFRLHVPEPIVFSIRLYDPAGSCSPYFTLMSDDRIVYQDNLMESRPFDKGWSYFGEYQHGTDQLDRVSWVTLNLPAGDYTSQIDVPEIKGSACTLLLAASVFNLDQLKASNYDGGESLVLGTRLIRISQRALELNIGSQFDLSHLRIRELSPWRGHVLKSFLSFFCSAEARRLDHDFLQEFANYERFVRHDDWARVHSADVRRLPYFIASMDKLLRDRPGRASIAASVCPTPDAPPHPSLSFTEVLSYLQSSKAFRYIAQGRLFDRESEKDLDTIDSHSKAHIAVSDGLGVPPGQVIFNVQHRNCWEESFLDTWPEPNYSFGVCATGATAGVELSEALPATVEVAENAISSQSNTRYRLRDALKSTLPAKSRVAWLVDEENFARVHVVDVKGWVNNSGQYWEQTYVQAVILAGEKGRKLQVTVDGTVATGAGSTPPSPNNYLKSMDGVSGYRLDNFASLIANKIRSELEPD